MKIFFITFFALSMNQVNAKQCTYSLNADSVKMQWIGYKFSSKTAVKGTFDEVDYKTAKAPKSVETLFESIQFTLGTASINSQTPARDKKLAMYIFGPITNPGQITGSVVSVNLRHKKAQAKVKLNDVERLISFSVEEKNNQFKFVGNLDLLDFGMSQSLKAIANACRELHTGKDGKSKTWSEVGIEVHAKVEKKC